MGQQPQEGENLTQAPIQAGGAPGRCEGVSLLGGGGWVVAQVEPWPP